MVDKVGCGIGGLRSETEQEKRARTGRALIRLEKKMEENPKTLQDLKELELLVECGDRAEVNRKVQEILAR